MRGIYLKYRSSQIVCMVMIVHITHTRMVLHMHKNLCMIVIENTIENYLLCVHTDHYALRK